MERPGSSSEGLTFRRGRVVHDGVRTTTTTTRSRSWAHRDVLPSFRKLSDAFTAVGFRLCDNPARPFWRLSDYDVKANIRHFQRTCTAAGVGQLETTGKLDDATMATLMHLFANSPEQARSVFLEA